MELRIEHWNGHPIRFIGDDGDWKAIGYDVALALGYKQPDHAINSHVDDIDKEIINLNSRLNQAGIIKAGNKKMLVISEFGIYSLIFKSKMKQAKEFQRWTYHILQQLRLNAGLQGYQAFQLLDQRIQQQAMARLEPASDTDYIKANVIADKATSNLYGYPKMVKKRDMNQAMLKDRAIILNDVVDLMNAKNRFHLDNLSVSETIYNRYKRKAA